MTEFGTHLVELGEWNVVDESFGEQDEIGPAWPQPRRINTLSVRTQTAAVKVDLECHPKPLRMVALVHSFIESRQRLFFSS